SFTGFVKRVFNAFDPSVNHLIIIENTPGAAHTFSTDTNNDLHEVTGLTGVNRIYYLLFARANGGYIDDAAMIEIMKAFLQYAVAQAEFISTDPQSGTTPPAGQSTVTINVDAGSM